jgi:tRNA (cmo5U34)-methyltransferase
MDPLSPSWNEENTRTFLDRARYFVFEREYQIETLCRLIPDPGRPFRVIELCCGEGLLAEMMLKFHPQARVRGLDGSRGMLEKATRRLAAQQERFSCAQFELSDESWRKREGKAYAVLSSLALHHLDGLSKARLYKDVYRMLEPGGVFLVADLFLPQNSAGMEYAAWAYDDAVRQRALAIDGDEAAFQEFQRLEWNFFRHPDDPIDHPSTLLDQLRWLEKAGFSGVDVFWLRAGHAIFGGTKK